MKADYTAYMIEENLDGSNKASSYLRALELLQPILAQKEVSQVSETSNVLLLLFFTTRNALF